MNPGELRSAALRLSVGDRLRLIWDLVRSLLSWDGAIKPSVPAEPSLEGAIARIEPLIDQAASHQPHYQPQLKTRLLDNLRHTFAQSPSHWQTLLTMSEAALSEKVALLLATEALLAASENESEADQAELQQLIEGR
ncbi:hypothetical protein H6G51_12945 [Limnothrix sp. FACHB-708]|uniref:hypothetical protein n=1 Tax=unclassified Limnothrix TaxID=2632864 RepID=UPI00168983FE|nr:MULTISPECIES: hypothetical protein [unclassified Limnothrix]MBD2554189.1 hypothetical protein [Limnothrix sp. FACHB-708]MBD2591071.1 hypothetical protein [Limnothrix sp. FACHB-406]